MKSQRTIRLNRYLANASGISRRAADELIAAGQINVNDAIARIGQTIDPAKDVVTHHGQPLQEKEYSYVLLHKPVGYVCSRRSQGGLPTIYELLPSHLQHLQVAGRLDTDSSGLLVLTNDGAFANHLMHPRYKKQKMYQVTLNKSLQEIHEKRITKGVRLVDGPSALQLSGSGKQWIVRMFEGRNRQIRRTFEACGYKVAALHRIQMGPYHLAKGQPKEYYTVQKIDKI